MYLRLIRNYLIYGDINKMETTFALAITSAILYFALMLVLNKYSTEKKAPKQILIDACCVFVSIFASSYILDFAGYGSQKGGSMTAAFTTKPDF